MTCPKRLNCLICPQRRTDTAHTILVLSVLCVLSVRRMEETMSYTYIPIPEDHGQYIQERSFIISADLGQAFDYTAISVIERVITGRGYRGYRGTGERMFYLRHIERMRGMEYPAIVNRLKCLYVSEALKNVNKAVVIDLTGLGRPVYDIMLQAGFRRSLNAINITGGMDTSYSMGHYNVPKRELISCLQVQLQNNALRIAKGLKEANALIEELSNFQTKISDTGKDTYNGRSGVHDDMVMSLAMGVWLGCQKRFRMGECGQM